jgi:hypothetical protein
MWHLGFDSSMLHFWLVGSIGISSQQAAGREVEETLELM